MKMSVCQLNDFLVLSPRSQYARFVQCLIGCSIMFDVFYYYYYLFYSKVLRDSEPHLLTVMVLSLSEGLIVYYTADVLGVHLFCEFVFGKWYHIGVVVIIIGINYMVYHKTNRAKKLIEMKPMFFQNRRLSIVLTLLFFLISLSLAFWVADYNLSVLEECQ